MCEMKLLNDTLHELSFSSLRSDILKIYKYDTVFILLLIEHTAHFYAGRPPPPPYYGPPARGARPPTDSHHWSYSRVLDTLDTHHR